MPTKKLISKMIEAWGRTKEIQHESTIWRACRIGAHALDEFNLQWTTDRGGVIRAKFPGEVLTVLNSLTSETEVRISSIEGIQAWMWHEGLECAHFELITSLKFLFSPIGKK